MYQIAKTLDIQGGVVCFQAIHMELVVAGVCRSKAVRLDKFEKYPQKEREKRGQHHWLAGLKVYTSWLPTAR